MIRMMFWNILITICDDVSDVSQTKLTDYEMQYEDILSIIVDRNLPYCFGTKIGDKSSWNLNATVRLLVLLDEGYVKSRQGGS